LSPPQAARSRDKSRPEIAALVLDLVKFMMVAQK
jgi:hypothetical protein